MKLIFALLIFVVLASPCNAQQPEGLHQWPQLKKTTFTLIDAHRSLLTLGKQFRKAYFQNESSPDHCGKTPKWLAQRLASVPYAEAPLRFFIRDSGSMGCLIIVTDAEENVVNISTGLLPATSWASLSSNLSFAHWYSQDLQVQEDDSSMGENKEKMAITMEEMLVTFVNNLNLGAQIMLRSTDPKDIPIVDGLLMKKVRI